MNKSLETIGKYTEFPRLKLKKERYVQSYEKQYDLAYEFTSQNEHKISSRYVLGERQRRRLIKTPKVRNSKIDDKIVRKRDLLPERIHLLIEDVAVLDQAGYFDKRTEIDFKKDDVDILSKARKYAAQVQDQDYSTAFKQKKQELEQGLEKNSATPIDEMWIDLVDQTNGHQQFNDQYIYSGAYLTSREDICPDSVSFGAEVGSTINSLIPDDYDNSVKIDLIWGFLLGFFAQPMDSGNFENDLFNSVFDQLERRRELHELERSRSVQAMAEMQDMKEENNRQDVIEDTIKTKDYRLNEVLLTEVKSQINAPEISDEALTNLCAHIIDKIAEITPLLEIDQLSNLIESDITILESRSVKGVNYSPDIFIYLTKLQKTKSESSAPDYNTDTTDRLLYESTTESRRLEHSNHYLASDIAQEVDVNTKVVTELFNKFSLSEDNDKQYTHKPIVKPSQSKSEWTLTQYGELVLHILYFYEGSYNPLYWFAIAPEEISLYERKLIISVLDNFKYI